MDSKGVGRITPTQVSARVLAYCHDGVGLGHLRRTLNICEDVAVVSPSASFLVVTGSPYISLFRHGPGVDVVKLPSLAKVNNEAYRPKFLSLPHRQVLSCRESLLLETTRHFDPHVLLVDKAPVGVCAELKATLRWLRAHRPDTSIVFGMRDIEDAASVTIRQWSRLGAYEILEKCYDEVWVYGMRNLFDVARQYRLSPAIQAKMRFMGYLTRRPCDHPVSASRGVSHVLVTVGGGTDGAHVLELYLAEGARRMAASGVHSVLVAGPDLPAPDAHRLRATARRVPSTEWIDFEPCMLCRIRQADLIVTMGGYNTLCEIAFHRKPALVIPRTQPRREQAIRAKLWAGRGIVSALDPAALTPPSLAQAVCTAMDRGPKVTAPDLDLAGLDRVRDRLRCFWPQERRDAHRLCL